MKNKEEQTGLIWAGDWGRRYWAGFSAEADQP
jgi:hypothetical protein